MKNFNQGYTIEKIQNGCWELWKDGKIISQHSTQDGASRAWRHATDSYEFTCPSCGESQMLKRSMAMLSGLNSGHGSCLKCKKFLHLEIDNVADHTAKAELWDEYADRMRIKKKEDDGELDSESEIYKRMTDSESENLKNVKPEDIPK